VIARLTRFLLILIGVLLFAGAVWAYWLVGTEAGLRQALAWVNAMGDTRVEARRWQGTLLGPLQAEGLRLDTAAAHIQAARARLDWRPLASLRGRLRIEPVEVHDLRVTLKPAARQTEDGGELPVFFVSAGVRSRVYGLEVVGRTGEVVFDAEEVAFDAVLHHDLDITVTHAALVHPRGTLAVSGRLGLAPDAEVDLDTRWSVQVPGATVPLQGQGTVGGVLAELSVEQQVNAPWRARLRGRVVWGDGPAAWQAALQLEQGSLAALNPDWRALGFAGEVRGSGSGSALALTTALDLADPEAGGWTARGEVRTGPEGWRVPALSLVQQEGPGRLEGSGLVLVEQGGTVDLSVSWQDLGWPVAEPTTRSPTGTLTVRGHPDAYTLAGEAVLNQVGHPPGRVVLAGTGDRRQLTLQRLAADWLDGQVRGQASVSWDPGWRGEAELSVQGLNPGRLAPDWPGRVDASLMLAGTTAPQPLLDLELRSLGGQLRGQALDGRARLRLAADSLRIDALTLSSGTARLSASGTLSATPDLRFSLQAPDLTHLHPRTHGRLNAEGRLRGSTTEPWLRADLSGGGLQWETYQATALEVALDLDMSGGSPSSVQAQVDGLAAGGIKLAELTVSGGGRPAAHRLEVAAQLAPGILRFTAEGRYAMGAWQGRLRDSQWHDRAGTWEQQAPAALQLARDQIRLDQTCWAQETGRLCLTGTGDGRGVAAQARVERVPMAVFTPWLPREDLSVSGELNGELALAYRDGLRRLQARLQAENGAFRLDLPGDEVMATDYRRIAIEASGVDAGLQLGAAFELASGDFARADLRLPGWQPGAALTGDQPLSGRAEASLGQLVWVSLFVPELIIPDGRLEADVDLGGTLARPVVAGRASLDGGVVAIPLLGIELSDLRLLAQTNAAGRMQVHMSARSGSGRAAVDGTVARTQAGWEAGLRLRGEAFQVIRLPVAEVQASPDLVIEVAPGKVHVTGQLAIPRARVNMEDLAQPAQASPDVVLVDGDGAPVAPRAPPWQVTAEVEVAFGDEVRISGYGLQARLGGRLTVMEPARGPTTARGEINVLEGKYEAYGQSLTIPQGRLFYANAPLDNPGIDVRAVRQVEEVTVGIVASGRLKTPEVRLYSEPTMDDSQVLAYLVLGRAIDTATREEADLLQRAAVSLGLAGGSRLTEDLAGELGVDVLEVETSTQRQEAALVLGKYLSPRLYVQYAVGLFQTQDSLRVRYRLSDNWTLEAQSGTRAGADILYTIEQ
jgi:translocation and assembly module TamB